MMEWWGTLLISLASAAVSGIISGFFALRIEKRRQRYQNQQTRKNKLKKEYDERPRLILKKFVDIQHGDINSPSDCECILLNIEKIEEDNGTLLFSYDKKALDKKNLCCVEYEFENFGKTEIQDLCLVSTHPQTTSMIELERRETLIKEKILCYEAWSEKRSIRPGDKVSIKVCYVKDKVMISPISASAAIYLCDINGNLWHQPLFCPTSETDNSTRGNYKEFRENRNIRLALDCFKNHSLW